jgi:hypothetical protein
MSEDTDRLPDGVPHAVIGLTAFYAITLAVALAVALTTERLSLVVLSACTIPLVVWMLSGKAERQRDHAHPSR